MEKLIMKKRFFSILLCIVMVFGMLPAQHVHADWEEGFDCDFCGNYIWGDWICDCGGYGIHCSKDSEHYDCYEENHCSECGEFYWEEDRCAECGLCYNCAGDNGFTGDAFCPDCNRCVDCVPEEGFYFCLSCGRCADCTPDGKFCDMCYRCYDCGGGLCSEGTDHPCQSCHDGYTCRNCDQCLLVPDSDDKTRDFCYNCYLCEDCVEKCSGWGEGHYYCLEEHDDFDYCPDCKHCYLVDIMNAVEGKTYGCEECNKCANCVAAVCKECGKCSDCIEICERCGEYCLDCHDGQSNVCPSCNMCYRGVSHCPDCGYCEECSDICKRCGSCRTCEYSHHCNICGACDQSGIYLCEECLRCPDCTLFCDKCGECVICHPDNHCTDCKEHYDDDELCPDCGRCASCIGGYELCEYCGYCFDCAEDWHCSECQGCKNDGKEICESCRMCLDCADTANQHCGSLSCNNCYEDYLYCEICDECIECIGEDNYCFDCYQCKEHHGDDGCDGEGSHTHKVKDEWEADGKNHWQECRQCKEKVNTAAHTFNLNKKCTVCGYDATELIQFTSQPKDKRAKVSDTDADEDDPLFSKNNTVTFSVTAKAFSKGTLSYQWYCIDADYLEAHPEKKYNNPLTDIDGYSDIIQGAKTSKLTTFVSTEACVANLVYFCRVTLTSSDGTVLYTADSDMAELKGIHVYNRCEPVDFHFGNKIWFPRGTGSTYSWLESSDGTHRYYCCGEGDEENYDPRGKAEVHNYGTAETITASIVDPESSSFEEWKEFYKYTCADCGFVSYVEKHVHNYEVPLYLGDEEALAFLTANVTDELHPLRCTVEGCSSVIYEEHDYQPTVYAPPTKNADGTVSLGQYQLECHECEYVLSGRSLYEGNNDTSWDPLRILVTAKNTAVQVLDSSDEFDTFCLATPGATIVLTPQQKDGQKVTSWKIKYTDYTQKDSSGKYKTVDLIRPVYKDDTNGTWWLVAPDQKYYESWDVNNGGWLYLTPVYTECKHENGTKLVNKKDAVCIYEGYTGDEACVDCGEIIGKIGDYIPAPSDEHEGEWVLIEGTKVEANCKHGGYTGDYQCSECGDIREGKKVPVKHGERELRNVKAATCVSTGSTGDVYCKDCGKKLMSGRIIPIDSDNHVNTTTSHIRESKCTVKGSISARKCKDCGEVLIKAQTFPALGHLWDEGTVTTEPTTTETGVKTYHCTRTGCTKTKTATIPTLASTAIETVAVTVKAPVYGETATKATNTADTYTIANTSWADYDGYDLPIGDAFKGGKAYTVRVELEAEGDNVFTDSTKYTINGETAKVVSWYIDHAILTYTFPTTEGTTPTPTPTPTPTHITSVNFTLGGYEYGKMIAGISVTPDAATNAVLNYNNAYWSGSYVICTNSTVFDSDFSSAVRSDSGDTLQADTQYYLVVTLRAKEGYDIVGLTESNITLSGKTASAFLSTADPEHSVHVVFKLDRLTGSSFDDFFLFITNYAITVEKAENGEVKSNCDKAVFGTTVTITVDPDKGYETQTLTVLNKSGKEIELTDKGDGKYTFKMPNSDVTVKAVFVADKSMTGFDDVTSDAYYGDAVKWAADKGITTGLPDGLFDPDGICNRAQAVTFLWRAAGSPAPMSTEMPFTDVKADSYYYDAVLWAFENGITKGTSSTTFSPDIDCSRAQIVTFLWRSQKASAATAANPFTDVDADEYYYDAIMWAVENGITIGTSETTFSPDMDCTRAQIVTFIYRCMK